MAQNMMTSEHKATNEKYRINYDVIFKGKEKEEPNEMGRKQNKK